MRVGCAREGWAERGDRPAFGATPPCFPSDWFPVSRITDHDPVGFLFGFLFEFPKIVCKDDPVRDLRLVHQREGRALRRTVRRWEIPAADCREHHREVGEHDHRDVECEEVESKTVEEGGLRRSRRAEGRES